MRKPLGILSTLAAAVVMFAGCPLHAPAQQKLTKAAAPDPSGMSLHAASTAAKAEVLLNPLAPEWEKVPAQRIALNRTPPLYDTESSTELEIPFVDVRLTRSQSKLLVQMIWRDATKDAAVLAKLPDAPTEGRVQREHTEATDRFFDSAAVMYPQHMSASGAWPSLQMGDAGDPVSIYFWNAARGAARMHAEGRGTTKRTNESFPAQGIYRDGIWHVAMELDEVLAGRPLAFAVWNGSQQDRDGRKYFSTWLKLE